MPEIVMFADTELTERQLVDRAITGLAGCLGAPH
jgi:hypothetical protein